MTRSTPAQIPHRIARFARRAMTALALTSAILTPAGNASAGQIASLSSGAWTGGAFTNRHTGSFSHCAVNAKYKSGVALFFAVTGTRQWSMGFAADHWAFKRGRTYPIQYQLDNGPVIKTVAVARVCGLGRGPGRFR